MIGTSAAGHHLIALSHTGEQHGDVMRDPEMVFTLVADSEPSVADPLSFQSDYLGLFQEMYRYDEDAEKTHVNARFKAELQSFVRLCETCTIRPSSARQGSENGSLEPFRRG